MVISLCDIVHKGKENEANDIKSSYSNLLQMESSPFLEGLSAYRTISDSLPRLKTISVNGV